MQRSSIKRVFFLCSLLMPSAFLKSATRSSRSAPPHSIVSFVWKNPSECKIDSLFQILLFEDKAKFRILSEFWAKSSLCQTNTSKNENDVYYLVKKSLVSELKKTFSRVHKKYPAELERALHSKEFQRFVLSELQNAYKSYRKSDIRSFDSVLKEEVLIGYVVANYSSRYKKGDLRRLVEFSVYRSANEITAYGNQWVQAAYTSVVRVSDGVGFVSRVSWGFEGAPEYEPGHASEDINGTFEMGITTLGNEKLSAELVGVLEVGNNDKPNQLLALNINFKPFKNEDIDVNLYASVDSNYDEKFIALSSGYSFESHPFEPIVNFFKKRRLKKNKESYEKSN